MPRTELRTEVEINAPIAQVYAVLTDLPSYHEWNPFLTAVSGELSVGKKLSLEMSLPEGKTYLLEPRLTQVTENTELRWLGRFWFPGSLEVEHFLLLSERAEGVT